MQKIKLQFTSNWAKRHFVKQNGIGSSEMENETAASIVYIAPQDSATDYVEFWKRNGLVYSAQAI